MILIQGDSNEMSKMLMIVFLPHLNNLKRVMYVSCLTVYPSYFSGFILLQVLLDLFKIFPFHLWRPTPRDLTLLRGWLIDQPIRSPENLVARTILLNMNWGSIENVNVVSHMHLLNRLNDFLLCYPSVFLWYLSVCLWYPSVCLWYLSVCLWYPSVCLWYPSVCLWYLSVCLWYLSVCLWYLSIYLYYPSVCLYYLSVYLHVVPICMSVVPICMSVVPICMSVVPICMSVLPICMSVVPICMSVLPICISVGRSTGTTM